MNTRLGRYELLRLLATGGMGEVLLARRDDGPTLYAVKRLLRHLAKDQGAIDRFAAEAHVAGQLAHPNIARVVDFDNVEGTWFIAMEYVHGPSLRGVLETCLTRQLPVSPRVAVQWVIEGLDALHHAHSRFKLVHGDVSPENILVAFTGVTKLVDFGLARAAAAMPAGRAWGKVKYTAPEKIAGEPIDARADVFAMGRVLHELVTLDDSLTTGVPEALLAIAARATHERPEQRFSSADEMAQALRQWLGPVTERGGLASRAVMTVLFGDDALRTAEQSISQVAAVGPLGTQPLMPIATVPVLTAVAASPLQVPTVIAVPPRSGSLPLFLLGGLLGALAVAGSLWAWSSRERADELPVTVSGPNDLVMPELELSIDDEDAPAEALALDAGTVMPEVALTQGFLTLHTRPSASVFLNGRFLGTTPLIHTAVPAGRLVLFLKAGKTGPSKKLSLTVGEGRHISLSTRLTRGR